MYKETPLIKQYYKIKLKYPDTILFFQVGEFYEIFGYDAILCSRLLDLTLTKRNKNKKNSIYLVGFPCNSLEFYIKKLIKHKYKIAICDQEKKNKESNELINRYVNNIVSPGVSIYEDITKKKKITKFICSIYINKNYSSIGISFLDFSTGEFLTSEGNLNYIKYIISSLKPKEFLIQKSKLFFLKKFLYKNLEKKFFITLLDDNLFNYNFLLKILFKHFKKIKLYDFGINKMKYSLITSGILINYIEKNYNLKLNHIKYIKKIEKNLYLWLDDITIKNLELFKSINNNGKSLLDILDKTKTSMGYRLLNNWIRFPLKNIKTIKKRHKIIDFFYKKKKKKVILILYNLKKIYDIEKLMSKIANRIINPNQLYKLSKTINYILKILELIDIKKNFKIFNFSKKKFKYLKNIKKKMENILIKNPINKFNKKFFIKKKISKKLDNYKKKYKKKKEKIKKYFFYIKEKINFKYLNIDKSENLGYYIEIKKNEKKKIPKNWIIKQKLSTILRYTNKVLNKYEYYIYIIKKKIFFLEKKIFYNIINNINDNLLILKKISFLIAEIDVLFSFFLCSKEYNYIKPKFYKNKLNSIKIIKGRHPVIEQNLFPKKYIPNNISLDNKKKQVLLITGPNMAGKSAILRQTALIILMAQIGSYVPAEYVKFNIIDKIFSRIGASDNISIGESTFMVEMNETSYILNNITEKSLIIMDEIGRGTSTFDGIALSYSIIKYIIKSNLKPKLLFATHFHELKNLLKKYKNIRYKYFSIIEKNKKIIFNRKLKNGLSLNSYGIYIAYISGLPRKVIKDSKKIFKKLKKKKKKKIYFFFNNLLFFLNKIKKFFLKKLR